MPNPLGNIPRQPRLAVLDGSITYDLADLRLYEDLP